MNLPAELPELPANTVDTTRGDNDLEDEVVDVVGNDIQDYNANTETAEQARADDEPNEVICLLVLYVYLYD